MYHADAFNRAGLFQRLGGWTHATPSESKLPHYFSAALQRAYHALFHIEAGASFQEQARGQFDAVSRKFSPIDGEIQAASPMTSAAIIHITAAFTALRVFQDDMWQLLREASSAANAPNSIKDAVDAIARASAGGPMKRAPRWFSDIPASLNTALVAYWNSIGKRTATYRDTDQHHNVVATGCFIKFDHGKVLSVAIVIPDNPEVKSVVKYTYTQRVDAIAFLRESFRQIHDLVELFAATFAKTTDPKILSSTLNLMPAIQPIEGREGPLLLQVFDYDGQHAALIGQTPDRRITYTTTPVDSSSRPSLVESEI